MQAAVTVPRDLDDFAGSWMLHRGIRHADGTEAEFRGTAVWLRDDAGANYSESGLLRIGSAAPIAARQVYRWDTGLNVFFGDGRFFHRVPPEGGPVAHWCEPDQYDGVYDFAAWPVFRVTWVVSGPRKAYRMVSEYAPAP